MQYNGQELVELKPEDWDGKSKEMFVWEANYDYPRKAIVIGYSLRHNRWVIDGMFQYEHYQYCAEITTEEKLTNIEYV